MMTTETKPTPGALAAAEIYRQYRDKRLIKLVDMAEIIDRLAVGPVEKRRDQWREMAGRLVSIANDYTNAKAALGLVRIMTEDPNDREALEAAKKLPDEKQIFEWLKAAQQAQSEAVAAFEKLAKAQACCTEQLSWIDDTVENCSVFKAAPGLGCGAGYFSPEQVRAKCAPLVEALKMTHRDGVFSGYNGMLMVTDAIAHAEKEGMA